MHQGVKTCVCVIFLKPALFVGLTLLPSERCWSRQWGKAHGSSLSISQYVVTRNRNNTFRSTNTLRSTIFSYFECKVTLKEENIQTERNGAWERCYKRRWVISMGSLKSQEVGEEEGASIARDTEEQLKRMRPRKGGGNYCLAAYPLKKKTVHCKGLKKICFTKCRRWGNYTHWFGISQ